MPRKGVSASRHVLAEARLGLHKRSGPKGTGRGKRRAGVLASEAQLAQAEENLRRLKEEVAVTIERSYNKLERTRGLVQVASQVVKLRQESERLAQNQLTQGVILASERKQAAAASYQAQTDFLQAKLGYLLAWAELEQATGIRRDSRDPSESHTTIVPRQLLIANRQSADPATSRFIGPSVFHHIR